jgi:hypothetical protein
MALAARGSNSTGSSPRSRATSICRASSSSRATSAMAARASRFPLRSTATQVLKAPANRHAVEGPVSRLRHPHQQRPSLDRRQDARDHLARRAAGPDRAAHLNSIRGQHHAQDGVIIIGGGQAGPAEPEPCPTQHRPWCWSAGASAAMVLGPYARTPLTTGALISRFAHDGNDRGAFMPACAFAAYLDRYARTRTRPPNGIK